MALKRKLTKDEFNSLPDHFKTEYKQKGDNYILDAEENDDYTELKTARDKEKNDRLKAEKDAKEAREQLTSIQEQLDELTNKGDSDKRTELEKLEGKYKKQIEKLTGEKDGEITKLKGSLDSILVDGEVTKLASELFRFTPEIFGAQLIKPRLKAMEKDGKFVTVALDKDGNESTVDALRAELLASSQFADILKPASRASGGGANHGQGGGNGGGGAATLTEQHKAQAKAQGLI